MNTEEKFPEKRNMKKILLWTTGGVVAAGLGWLGWKMYQRKKTDGETLLPDFSSGGTEKSSETTSLPELPVSLVTPPSGGTPKPANTDFPIKRGSRGEKVVQLQKAINKLLKGQKITEDGIYGQQVENALKQLNQTLVFDEQQFRVFTASVSSAGAIPVNTKAVGLLLHKYWNQGDFMRCVAALRLLNSVKSYSEANDYFKSSQIPGGRVSIVTGLITKFTQETQRSAFRNEFLRIGLKLGEDGKWTLSGFDSLVFCKTIRETTLTYPNGTAVTIPAGVVAGREIGKSGEFTVCKTADGITVSILTQDLMKYETP